MMWGLASSPRQKVRSLMTGIGPAGLRRRSSDVGERQGRAGTQQLSELGHTSGPAPSVTGNSEAGGAKEWISTSGAAVKLGRRELEPPAGDISVDTGGSQP